MAMISSFTISDVAQLDRCLDLLTRIGYKIDKCSIGVFGSQKGFMTEILLSDIVLAAFILTENTHPGFQAVAQDFYIKDDVNCMKQLKDHLSKLGLTSTLTMNIYPNPQDGKESMETISEINQKGEQEITITWKHMVEEYADPQNIPYYIFGQILKVTAEPTVFKQYLLDVSGMTSCERYIEDAILTVKLDGGQFEVGYGEEARSLRRSEWTIGGEAGDMMEKECSFTLFSIWTLIDWAIETNITEFELGFPIEEPAYAKAGEVLIFQS